MKTELYLTTIPETISPETLEEMYAIVSPERSQRAKRFLKDADRNRCLTGEVILRKMLIEKGVEAPQFHYGSCGKPSLVGGELHFNLSHAGEYVLLALSEYPVGVDIELPRKISDGVAEMVYTDEERLWIEHQSDKEFAFFRLWTLKESYIKAIGRGLQKALQEFSFTVSENRITLYDSADSTAEERFHLSAGLYQKAYWALCGEGECAEVLQEREFDTLLS